MTSATSIPVGASTHGRALVRVIEGLELFLAVGAWAGAGGLISGAMTLGEYAKELPFESLVLGGIALGLVVALPATIVVVASMRHLRWADRGHLLVGALLMGWIVVQVGFIGLNAWLQPFMFTLGLAIFVLGSVHLRHRPTA